MLAYMKKIAVLVSYSIRVFDQKTMTFMQAERLSSGAYR